MNQPTIQQVSQQQVGENLLFPLFRSLSSEYKQKYKKDIWEQFENNIRAAAYTARLRSFFENITRTMPIRIQQQYLPGIMQILESGLDKSVLTWLRDETTYLIMIARMLQEERKEDYKKTQEEISAADNYPGHPSMYSEQSENNSNLWNDL